MIKWTKYIPVIPTTKQLAAMMLPHREVLFGGAAGGGKSIWLLASALQYVDIPGYSAIIFRRQLTDLKQAGALLDRASEWLSPFPEVKYVPSEHCYYFPTTYPDGTPGKPARLQFGYIGDRNQRSRYQSAEYQFFAFDELTHWPDDSDYTYMFSRIRKTVCPIHGRDPATSEPAWKPDCPKCKALQSIPTRVRAATNPGGVGGAWVKRRFKIVPDPEKYPSKHEAIQAILAGVPVKFIGVHPERAFMPSFFYDNPHVDREDYTNFLKELDDETRRQLQEGNWEVIPNARFNRAWAKYFSFEGDIYRFADRSFVEHRHLRRIFITVDPAATVKDGPIDQSIREGSPSWTVISTWGITEDWKLLWLDMVRFRKEIPDVVDAIVRANEIWKPDFVKIEYVGVGIGVAQYVQQAGIRVVKNIKRRDKLENSTSSQMMMKAGRIFLPENAPWVDTAEDEVFTWTGDPSQQDDIVDTLSDAAVELTPHLAPIVTPTTRMSRACPPRVLPMAPNYDKSTFHSNSPTNANFIIGNRY